MKGNTQVTRTRALAMEAPNADLAQVQRLLSSFPRGCNIVQESDPCEEAVGSSNICNIIRVCLSLTVHIVTRRRKDVDAMLPDEAM